MRTFLALCFSVGTTRRLAEAVEREASRLAASGAKLAWVPPANYHVTLKFFGDIPAESLDAIAVRLKQRCADLPPIELRAKGYGTFPVAAPGGEAPRILWVGIDDGRGGKAISGLQSAIENDMAELGFAKESRPFHPHLTVARVLEPGSAPLVWQSDPGGDLGADKIPEIIVYESQSKPRLGVEYIARARIPFLKK